MNCGGVCSFLVILFNIDRMKCFYFYFIIVNMKKDINLFNLFVIGKDS